MRSSNRCMRLIKRLSNRVEWLVMSDYVHILFQQFVHFIGTNWCIQCRAGKSTSCHAALVVCLFQYIEPYQAPGHQKCGGPWSWMLGHSKPRSVVTYTSQMFAKTSPEVSPSLTNVTWASVAGYVIDKILGQAGEKVTDVKGRFRTSYLSPRNLCDSRCCFKDADMRGNQAAL